MISERMRATLSLANKRTISPDSRMEATDLAARRIAKMETDALKEKTARLAALRRAREEAMQG